MGAITLAVAGMIVLATGCRPQPPSLDDYVTDAGSTSGGPGSASVDGTVDDSSSTGSTSSMGSTLGVSSASSSGTTGSGSGATNSDTSTTGSNTDEGASSSSDSGGLPAEPPLARADGPYMVSNDLVLAVAAPGVLGNDEDPEGGSLMVTDYDPMSSAGGVVIVEDDGAFSYDPPAVLPFGTDRFSYEITDAQGLTATAEVRVVVQLVGGAIGLDALGIKGVRLDGALAGDNSGYAVSGAGDVDGDGHADVVVGAFSADPLGLVGAGESHWVRGRPAWPVSIALGVAADLRLDGIAAADASGRAVSGAGDVNGDGHADLVVGAAAADPGGNLGAGESYLVYGGPGLLGNLSLGDAGVLRFTGIDPGDAAGRAVSGAGDVNGDGYADVLVGAYFADPSGVSSGESYLVYGGPALPELFPLALADVRFEGVDSDDLSGVAVSGAGDVNGDGYADVIIGANTADSLAGASYLVFGGTPLPPVVSLAAADVRIEGAAPGDFAGGSVSGVGDVDGDGFGDLLVGAPGANGNVGASHLVYGAGALPAVISLAAADVTFDGIDLDDNSGTTVSGAGDVNADGYADLLVGAYHADPLLHDNAGESYLVLGGPGLMGSASLGTAAVRFEGIDVNDVSGWALSGAGDVDGDGYADLLIGAYQGDPAGQSNAGESYIVLGDDLWGQTSVLGTAGADDLLATGGLLRDIVVAGRGDDTLRSDGGDDVLRGGQGDDALVIVDGTFFRVDGGLGLDTLELGMFGLLLDLPALGTERLRGIERIQLSVVGPSSLIVSELYVVNLSDTSNTLIIEGDGDDDVSLVDGTWSGPVPDGGYEVYASTSTAAIVRVDSDVVVMIP